MKARIIVIALLCFGIACQAQNKVDRQGRKQGHWVKTDRNGAKIYEGDFVDGQETGVFKYFWPNGTVKIQNTFSVPGKYCSHEAWDEQGNLIARGFYNQKNRDSVWTFYNQDGKVVKKATYRMGVKYGMHIVFNANGDTVESQNWTDNHRNGPWYRRIGKKGYMRGTYVMGGLEGKLVEYNDEGQLVREGNYKNGRKDGIYRYYQLGQLIVDEKWGDGQLVDRKILLSTPTPIYLSIYDIAYFHPKGSKYAVVYKMDGTQLTCQEDVTTIGDRIRSDMFSFVDRKSRISANVNCIKGLTRDSSGRVILDLDPKPQFSVFPDDDCMKMLRSVQRTDKLD